MTELVDLVRGVLAVDPSAPAMEFEGRWNSWSDLSIVMDAIQRHLAKAELGAGTRIGVLMRNHVLTAATILEVVLSDCCIVTLNPILPDERLSGDILALKPPVLIGLDTDWARPAVLGAAEQIGCLGLSLTMSDHAKVELVPGLDRLRGADLNREAPGIAVEMLSSGTTGVPKRIPLKASSFARGIIGAGVFDGRAPGDPPKLRGGVQVLNTPFSHIGGVFGLFNTIAAGRRSCLLERFTVDGWADAVRRHRPKVAGAPPSALRMILDRGVPKEDLSSLLAFRTSTAPLEPALADEFYDRYGVPVLQNYGATEFAGGVAGWTLDAFKTLRQEKRGSVGQLNAGVEGRIVDPETGATLPLSNEGLLELRAAQLGDGKSWIRTTDLAVLDQDNYLWIKGRYDNAIIRGGFKVFPDDVVRAIEQHPAVREAAVVGIPDARLGSVPAAAYIVKAGCVAPTDLEWRAFLKDRLLPYQAPVILQPVEDMPRTPSLKVSQPDLRALLLNERPA